MKRLAILFFSSFAAFSLWAGGVPLDSLYHALDAEIARSDEYARQKEQQIAALRTNIGKTRSPEARFQMLWKMYQEYESFMNDSALAYLEQCTKLARQQQRTDLLAQSLVATAHQYAKTGYYSEAVDYFGRVPRSGLGGETLKDYYAGLNHLYGEMGYYTKDRAKSTDYYRLSMLYRDSLYQVIPVGSTIYYHRRVSQLCNDKQYDEARRMSDEWLKKVQKGTPDYAMMAFFRSEIYKGLGNTEEQKRWLAESALSDIRSAVMDQASLWSLAEILGKEGDVSRSNRYVEYSWNCIQRYSTHLRSWLVSPVLGVISNSYKLQLRSANNRLWMMVGVVSLMALFLLASLFYVSRKRKQLARARNDLRDTNQQLQELNMQLSDRNQELSQLNARLGDANRVKDEYIGNFLSICSDYIDKLDNYRIKVNRKLKAGQAKDLLRMTESEQLKDDELKELFNHFDSVFLNLFPHFVTDFNSLLRPDSQIIPPMENRLTTDLRIFALIRLGIEESSKIADFLHYSPNSIYNYRARIKNKAVCGRDEFERRVKEIGIVQK